MEGFRGIRPSQSDDPHYPNVPDGNSENSVPSVLKKTCVVVGISTQAFGTQVFFLHAEAQRGGSCASAMQRSSSKTSAALRAKKKTGCHQNHLRAKKPRCVKYPPLHMDILTTDALETVAHHIDIAWGLRGKKQWGIALARQEFTA